MKSRSNVPQEGRVPSPMWEILPIGLGLTAGQTGFRELKEALKANGLLIPVSGKAFLFFKLIIFSLSRALNSNFFLLVLKV